MDAIPANAMLRCAIGLMVVCANAHATCYQLFNQAGAQIYDGMLPPFDISLPDESPSYAASRARGEYLLILPTHFCAAAYDYEPDSESDVLAGYARGRSSGGGHQCDGRPIEYGPRGAPKCRTATGKSRYLSQDR